MDVIATHSNTDFDAFASMLAVRRLYPGAVVAISGSLNRNVREFYRLHADELDVVEAGRLDVDRIERLIVVEALQPERLGELEAVARRPGVDVLAFDHHAGEATDWIRPENLVVSDDGALTTTLVGVLAERELPVSPLEATVFALGIHEDTGSLTYPGVTRRDADALAWCLRHGAQQDVVARYLHTPLGESERALLDALLGSLETIEAGGFELLLAAVSWPTYVDGISNLAHKLVDLTDCRALVLLVEMDERVFCVVRARGAELDAAAVARELGGGGHPQAASAVYRGTLEDARSAARAALPGAVRKPLTAVDIMSHPPRFVEAEDTVAHAMVLCQQHRQSGMLVGKPRALSGIVTREDLDKAIGHELSHAPVKSVMSSNAVTCRPETPLAELHRLLASTDVGRLPVLGDGEVLGVVTRSDLLRAFEEPVSEGEEGPEASIAEQLAGLERLAPVFEAAQAVSEGYEGVYLVGGAVRDVLMSEPSFDVDVAVEGDGIAFAEALGGALGGRIVPHEKFGTAIVISAGGERVDVATARTEFYDYPAALPRVERASIRQDLFRRDFTINAMAASLRGEDFGRLVDPFGGLRDLERRVVRVLHNLSFIDDPTRIFRAIRYENRYGFAMDAHTVGLARACVEMDLVGELSSARLRDELQALLGEARVGESVLRLSELGIDRAIHPHLAADQDAVELIETLDGLRARYTPEVPAWRLRLAALGRALPPDELYDWFARLKIRRRDADLIADAVTVAPKLSRLLEDATEPAVVHALVAPHDPDGALFALAAATGPARERLEQYFDDLRGVRLEISGADLAELGVGESPQVGAILEEVLRRKLNGEVEGRAAELEAARELLDG